MSSEQHKIIDKYAELLLRWDKVILGCLLFSLSTGLAVYLMTPKVYQSTSLIIYQQSRVNPSKFSPDEEKKIEEMVSTVSQQVTSRTSLEGIINQFNLYRDQREKLPIEDVVAMMREKQIQIRSQQSKGNVFSVTFNGNNPRATMQVTNVLASKFIEENLRVREERATETTAYIKDELRMAKEALDKKEAIMRDYKLQYYNEMPDQRAANMQRLNALQEQYQAILANIHNLEQTRLLVAEQSAVRKDMLSLSVGGAGKAAEQPDDLASARQQLEKMLARYTEEHPDVKQLKKRIQQLELENSAAPAKAQGGSAGEGEAGAARDKLSLPARAVDINLKNLRFEGDKVLQQIRVYQEWIDRSPVREAEWAAITRDHEELKKHYEYLVAQGLNAEASESLERRQKGSQFKIIDPAYLPEKPIKPDFLKIMLAALGLGLGSGVGMVFLFDFFDTSFRDAAELENYLHVPVLCAVPFIITEGERRKEKILARVVYCGLAGWFVLLGGALAYLFHRGALVI
ncbi:GumC family protein [Thiovibrio sp. JS02]